MRHNAKALAYRHGLLHRYHRRRNRTNLTAVMFHRVLPANDPRAGGADPLYTISPEEFADCLSFFKKHYNVVSLEQMLEDAPLPERPLIITLDDGWADNAEYAAGLLKEADLPAVVFVAGAAVGRAYAFWQERLYWAWSTGATAIADLEAIARGAGMSADQLRVEGDDEHRLRSLTANLDRGDPNTLTRFLERVEWGDGDRTVHEMMSEQQLRELATARVAVGLHGHTHLPLDRVDAQQELQMARERITRILGEQSRPATQSMSFPHGRYDADAVAGTRRAGCKVMFSSNRCVTPLTDRSRLTTDLIGRVQVDPSEFLGSDGRFSPSMLAWELFTLPRIPLRADGGRDQHKGRKRARLLPGLAVLFRSIVSP